MKVILLQDVKTLGKKGDMIEINDGYARNYVLPKKLAVEANEVNKNNLKLQKANSERIAKEQLEAAQTLAAELKTKSVTITIKAGEGGRVFGAVTGKEIAKAYADQYGVELDKKKIQLPESIKSIGNYEVALKLHPKVTANLTVKVVQE